MLTSLLLSVFALGLFRGESATLAKPLPHPIVDYSGPLSPRWWDSTAKGTPPTVVLDGQKLVEAKAKIRSGDGYYYWVLSNLLTRADSFMDQGPWTVRAKTLTVPNGTSSSYASQAPYWWPKNYNDTSSNVTCPYIQRDGIRNPEVDLYTDHADRQHVFDASYLLTLAWYYTDDVAYRVQAAAVIRTWFLNNGTRMTPDLQHAQIIPCANDGRAIGIIDFSQQYTSTLDAVAILSTVYDKTWSQADDTAFRSWNTDFLTWLTTSKFGKDELAAENNHGTFAAMQIAAIAAYLDQTDLARSTLESQKARIDKFIAANGTQPLELVRTRSWHYSTFDLVAWTRMAAVGKAVGVDLWGYKGPQGQSILGAIDYLIPAATNQTAWPYPELSFFAYAATDIIHAAADEGDSAAQVVQWDLTPPPGGDLYVLRPAVEQLDNISDS